MKIIINIIALSVFIFFDCSNKNADIKLKFNSISKLDFAPYNDVQIIKRNDIYFIEMNSLYYKVKRSFWGGNINFVGSNGKKKLSNEVESKIENLIAFYENIDVLSFKVDKEGNVYLSIPWHDRCTYYFLKLMKSNSLENMNKKSYKAYDGNWYLDKECSVSGL